MVGSMRIELDRAHLWCKSHFVLSILLILAPDDEFCNIP
jgi:hypothetical protein